MESTTSRTFIEAHIEQLRILTNIEHVTALRAVPIKLVTLIHNRAAQLVDQEYHKAEIEEICQLHERQSQTQWGMF